MTYKYQIVSTHFDSLERAGVAKKKIEEMFPDIMFVVETIEGNKNEN